MISMQKNKLSKTNAQGFTLVELMVVMVVIVILSSITIVGFGSWRTRVAETEVKSDLYGVKAGMEAARNHSNGYPVYAIGTVFDGTNSTRAVFRQSENVIITYRSGSATTYCVQAQSNEIATVTMFVNMGSSNKEPQPGTC